MSGSSSNEWIFDKVFYRDGSLRDIYVSNTTPTDWQKLITWLGTGTYPASYRVEGLEAPLPTEFEEIQKHMGQAAQRLTIYIEGCRLNCHFFFADEIELDLLPNDVDTQEKAQAVLAFMSEVGRLLKKAVVLTPENVKEHPLVRYNSKTDCIEYSAD